MVHVKVKTKLGMAAEALAATKGDRAELLKNPTPKKAVKIDLLDRKR